MRNKKSKYFIRLLVSILFIMYCSFKVDWGIIVQSFGEVAIAPYGVSTFFGIICTLFLAFKYSLFIKDTRLELPITRLLIINYISRFYALLIPTALGPEAVRWYKVTDNKAGRSFFLASIMVERIFFLLILLLFGTIPLFFYSDINQIIILRQKIAPILIFAYAIFFIMLIYFLLPSIQVCIKRNLKKYIKIKQGSKADQFLENFSLKNLSFSLIIWLIIYSLLWQLFFIGRVYFLFITMNLQLNLIDVAWMGSIVLLLQVLPISFAGLGIREGAFAYLFTLFGLIPEKGFLLGILFFSQMLIFAGLGAIFYLFEP